MNTLPNTNPVFSFKNETPANLENQIVHPVQRAIQTHDEAELRRKNFTLAQVYGSTMPMRLEMEKQIFGRQLRLPGTFQSENIALDILSGRDTTIEFEDYLNDPSQSEVEIDYRDNLEKYYGLKKLENKFSF